MFISRGPVCRAGGGTGPEIRHWTTSDHDREHPADSPNPTHESAPGDLARALHPYGTCEAPPAIRRRGREAGDRRGSAAAAPGLLMGCNRRETLGEFLAPPATRDDVAGRAQPPKHSRAPRAAPRTRRTERAQHTWRPRPQWPGCPRRRSPPRRPRRCRTPRIKPNAPCGRCGAPRCPLQQYSRHPRCPAPPRQRTRYYPTLRTSAARWACLSAAQRRS